MSAPRPSESRHRAQPVRPRYGRLVLAGVALLVTATALLGGVGVLPSVAGAPSSRASSPAPTPSPTSYARPRAVAAPTVAAPTAAAPTPAESSAADVRRARAALPADSGTGRRIVFSQGRQRVWLVDRGQHVQRTYRVSGSVLDNLHPGRYAVYSKSRWAVGVSDSGVMQYFVRFTQGPTGAAIGFHTIPSKDGTPVQTRGQLGTPRSHGCIRQAEPDAIALWDFAPVGTQVDVVSS